MERLVLFDIDSTLIDARGAGGRAMRQAILEVYGVSGDLGDYSFHGRTDPAIIRDLAKMWGADGSAAAPGQLERCLERYVSLLHEELGEDQVDVLPGVRDLVLALSDDARVLLGLLTGNVAEGAHAKLAPTGMLHLFAVGAYGSDSAERSDLPLVAVDRAGRLTGRRFSGKQIVVIGDTPADIQCGAALDVATVAVATGRHSVEELAQYHPDHLFSDFRDWRTALRAITGDADGAAAPSYALGSG